MTHHYSFVGTSWPGTLTVTSFSLLPQGIFLHLFCHGASLPPAFPLPLQHAPLPGMF